MLHLSCIMQQEHRKQGKICPQLSNIPSPYGLCQGEVDAKRGPKLNWYKNLGKGWGVILQLCELSSKWILTKKLHLIKKNWGKEGGGGGLKPKQYARLCQMR